MSDYEGSGDESMGGGNEEPERRYNTRSGRRHGRQVEVDPTLYVGYCEDFETPEMIMKKFAELSVFEEKRKAEQKKLQEEKDARKAERRRLAGKKPRTGKEEISDTDSDSSEVDSNEEDDNNSDEENGLLSHEDLKKVFKQTSTYTISSVLNGNEIMQEKPILTEDGFICGYEDNIGNHELNAVTDFDLFEDYREYENYYISDEDYDDEGDSDFWEDMMEGGREACRRQRRARKARSLEYEEEAAEGLGYYDSGMDGIVLDYTQVGSRDTGMQNREQKKITTEEDEEKKKLPCDELHICMVPPHPLPRSMGYRINKLNCRNLKLREKMKIASKDYIAYNYQEHNDLSKITTNDLGNKKYVGIMIDCPFDMVNSRVRPRYGCVSLDQYRKLPIPNLMDNGFLFVWTPPELIYEMCTIAEEWGFTYADHACFIKRRPNFELANQPAQFINQAKEDLLVFRKAKEALFVEECKGPDGHTMIDWDAKDYAGKIHIRHQRSSDVHFNFLRYHHKYKQFGIKPPQYGYELVEILLPDTTKHMDIAKKQKWNKEKLQTLEPKMLYLWAPRYEKRNGWDIVVDKKHIQYLKKMESVERRD